MGRHLFRHLITFVVGSFVISLLSVSLSQAQTTTTKPAKTMPSCKVDFTPVKMPYIEVLCEKCKPVAQRYEKQREALNAIRTELIIKIGNFKKLCAPFPYPCQQGGPTLSLEEQEAAASVAAGGKCTGGKQISHTGAYYDADDANSLTWRQRLQNSATTYTSTKDLLNQLSQKLRRPIDSNGVCYDCIGQLTLAYHSNAKQGMSIGEISLSSTAVTGKGFATSYQKGRALEDFAARLSPMMCKSGQIVFAQCNSATSKENQKVAQDFADATGLTIAAPDGTVCRGLLGEFVYTSGKYYIPGNFRGIKQYTPATPNTGTCDSNYKSAFAKLSAARTSERTKIDTLIKDYEKQIEVVKKLQIELMACEETCIETQESEEIDEDTKSSETEEKETKTESETSKEKSEN